MPDEEITGTTPESTPGTPATPETPAVDTEKESATDFFKRELAGIEKKETAEVQVEKPQVVVETTTEEPEETEEIDEAEILKRSGFSQKSLADIKADMDKARTQTEMFNWANSNIPGFAEFLTQRMLASRGLAARGPETLGEFGKTLEKPSSQTPEQISSAREKLLAKGYDEEKINELQEILSAMGTDLGYVRRDELREERQKEQAQKAQETAVSAFESFGKSDQVKEQLGAMGLDWDANVKAEVVRVLLDDFGIADFGHVNQKNIARAYNAFIMEKQGGIEQLLTNVKNKAAETHKEKLKLGQMVPKTGTATPTPPKNLEDWINDPNTSAEDIKKKMFEVSRRR